MYTPQKYKPVSRKRLNSVIERQVVNGVGLGEVDGLFNIGKMFTRMFTFTPSSFKISNIAGAIGSVAMTTASGGLTAFAPKISSAHSTISKDIGYGVAAAAAATGLYLGGSALLSTVGGAGKVAATGTGLIGTAAAGSTEIGAALAAPIATGGGGILSAVGSGLSTVGSGLMTALKALPLIGQVLGGGGGGAAQQQAVDYGPAQPTAEQIAAQQAYEAQVAAQQAQMYQPGYAPNIPYVAGQYAGAPTIGQPGTMDTAYGDLKSPYTAISEDGQQVQVDPRTGQVVQASMIPDLAPATWLAIGGATLVGWYLMSGSEKK